MPDPQPADPSSDLTPIHFLTAGTHTDSRGTRVTFSDGDLTQIADDYDPALHEAPIVIGHPRDDAPAYGWVRRIDVDADGATALAGQIDQAFSEALQAGRFKKVSAAIYLPDSPANPKPGGYYLRHIGLLGAMPPAIKGLKQTQFGDGGGYVTVDFGEVSGFTLSSLFRSLRDFMIEQFGGDKADKALPGYLVDSLRDDAVMPSPADPTAAPAYSETSQNLRGERREQVGHGDPQQPGAPAVSEGPARTAAILSEGDAMSDEIAAKAAALAVREKVLAAQEAEFAERRRRDEAAAVIAAANESGVRVLPVDVPAMKALLAQIDDKAGDVAFREGEDGAAISPRAWFSGWLGRLPVQVALGEFSRAAGDGPVDDAEGIAKAALAFQEDERRAGRDVRIDVAVRHVANSQS